MKKIVVIGGGAAGMIAAITAADSAKVVLIEKNDRLGKKLFITGKGRCNLTNACEDSRFFNAVTTNSKFMYSAFYSFDNNMTMDFFEKAGLPLKVERGDRVFPVSDHSSDVIGVLKTLINRNPNIKLMLNTKVSGIMAEGNSVCGVSLDREKRSKYEGKADVRNEQEETMIACDAVILCTGGLSYQLTGSTGDGYQFAKDFGHTIVNTQPSLVPFNIKEHFCKELMGLSLKNVSFNIFSGKKKIFAEQGELLFTHFGISGPLVIKASAYIHRYLDKDITLYIDLKPALSVEELDSRIQKDFNKYINKNFNNALGDLLPQKLITPVIERSGIDLFKKVHSISREERLRLVQVIKEFKLTFAGLRDFDKAIITKGGVNVKEINPSTMESKLLSGLYFAGEIIDVDALTGGFNLQIAWSTGRLAGICAAENP
ncbi:MAG: NAD(P)/FAD-dependent oxidoreductase [Coprococcus sp.]|nr:NAD(P)/FAD-dependent oxidoreductase [Coprococcus sp.]